MTTTTKARERAGTDGERPAFRFAGLGLRPRLFLAVLLASLLPVVLLHLVDQHDTRQNALRLAHDTLEHVVSVQQRRLNVELGRLDDQLALVASRTQMRVSLQRYAESRSPDALVMLERILADALGAMNSLDGIWLRDGTGRLVTGVTNPAAQAAGAPEPPLSGGDGALRVAWSATTRPLLWLNGELELDGRVIGSLHILASMAGLEAVLEDFPHDDVGGVTSLAIPGPEGGLRLLPRAGDEPAGRSALAARLAGRQVPLERLVAQAEEAPATLENTLLRARPLRGDFGHVIVHLSLATADRMLREHTRHLTAMIGLATLLCIAMAFVLARMIARPVDLLTRATRSLHTDSTAEKVPGHLWGEFGELARAFNHATAVIEHRTRELQQEIDARRLSQQRLADLANTDTLTGLANRRRFMHELAEHLRQAPPGERVGALLFIDLDGFKPVNDRLGHEAGDVVLQVIAGRLRHLVRERDLAARLGGDEFGLLLIDGHGEALDSLEVAARVEAQLGQPLSVKDERVHVGCSIGVAELVGGDRPQHALNRADEAMYRVKSARQRARDEATAG